MFVRILQTDTILTFLLFLHAPQASMLTEHQELTPVTDLGDWEKERTASHP